MAIRNDLIPTITARRALASACFLEGLEYHEIMELTGYSYASLSSLRKALGMGRKKYAGSARKNRLRQWFLNLKQAGYSYRQIGIVFGMITQHVQQVCAEKTPKLGRGACEKCGRIAYLHRHHESYIPEIVVGLCASCHGKQHRRTFQVKLCEKKPRRWPKTKSGILICKALSLGLVPHEIKCLFGVKSSLITKYRQKLGIAPFPTGRFRGVVPLGENFYSQAVK